MRPQLLLFPCNGNAMEALLCAEGQFDVLGFIDDSPEKIGSVCMGHPVYSRAALTDWPAALVLAVPGSPRSYRDRPAIIGSLELPRTRFATVIHSRAVVSPAALIGMNVLIMAGVVITSTAIMGDHLCVLPNSVIHHDVRIGDFSLIGSLVSLAGGVTVGRNCYVASGTSVRDGCTIGDGALVGLGTVVLRDVAPNSVVAGPRGEVLIRRSAGP